MRGSEIVCGGVYAFRQGRSGEIRRCLVLDVERVYLNDRGSLWATGGGDRPDNHAHRAQRPTSVFTRRPVSDRFLVAVEWDLIRRVPDPEHRHYGWKTEPAGTAWVPWAARSAELVSTWDEEIERRALKALYDAETEAIRKERQKEQDAARERRRLEHVEQRRIEAEQRARQRADEAARVRARLIEIIEDAEIATFPVRAPLLAARILDEFDVRATRTIS